MPAILSKILFCMNFHAQSYRNQHNATALSSE